MLPCTDLLLQHRVVPCTSLLLYLKSGVVVGAVDRMKSVVVVGSCAVDRMPFKVYLERLAIELRIKKSKKKIPYNLYGNSWLAQVVKNHAFL